MQPDITAGLVVTLKSGGATVVTSGSVFTFDPSHLTIELDDLIFHIQFCKDKEGTRIVPDPRPPKSLFLKLYNFDSPFGTGITTPIEVGSFKNQVLYFAFSVYSLAEDKGRHFHYTFYTKGAPNE